LTVRQAVAMARRFRFRAMKDGDLIEYGPDGQRQVRAGETFELSEAEAADFYRWRLDRHFELVAVFDEIAEGDGDD
jgi:hypothetical protein